MAISNTNLKVSQTNSYKNYRHSSDSKTEGKTAKGRIVVLLRRIAAGLLATVCAVATILTLPLSIPTYAALRIVDHYRGVQFKAFAPDENREISLSKFPYLLTVFPFVLAVTFGEFAVKGKCEF